MSLLNSDTTQSDKCSFDLDLPVECDDEYWDPSNSSSSGFAQPPGKPAIVVAFNCLLRLTQIQAYAQRTIVSPVLRIYAQP